MVPAEEDARAKPYETRGVHDFGCQAGRVNCCCSKRLRESLGNPPGIPVLNGSVRNDAIVSRHQGLQAAGDTVINGTGECCITRWVTLPTAQRVGPDAP